MRRFSTALGLLLLSLVPSVAFAAEPAPAQAVGAVAAPADARALFKAMASLEGLEAKFREEKKLALLRAPLVSEGRLFYLRGGYLARLTEKPSPVTVRITPTALEVNNGAGYEKIDLRGRADIKLFVESFARVLAGDYDTLAALYEMTYDKLSDGRFRLTLKPKTGTLAQLVSALELEGAGFGVDTIRIRETKGDSAVTHIELVSAKRKFTAEEQNKLFGAVVNAPGASPP